MTDILKKAKFPIIIIILLFLGFVVYNFVFKEEEPTSGLSEEEMSDRSSSQEFLPLLQLIKSVDFDDRFFTDKTFRSMVDFSQPVKEEKRGRDNPFSPDIVTSLETNPNAPLLEASQAENQNSTTTSSSNQNATSSQKTVNTPNN